MMSFQKIVIIERMRHKLEKKNFLALSNFAKICVIWLKSVLKMLVIYAGYKKYELHRKLLNLPASHYTQLVASLAQ